MDQVKFVEDCLKRLYRFKFFKGCLPQILLGPFLNKLTHLLIFYAAVTTLILKLSISRIFNTLKDLFLKQPSQVFCKKSCSEKFCNIHRRTLVLECLFNKVACLQSCNFNKKRLWNWCFPVNIANFLRAPI